jgi:hypothetical protein
VIGTVVDDRILTPDGGETRSLGGIAYAVAALATVAGRRLRVHPACRAGRGMRGPIERAWRPLPAVDLAGVVDTDLPHTRVELDYRAQGLGSGERLERLLDPMPPLQVADLSAVAATEVALVNLISGFDLELAAMQWISADRTVMLDVHSLVLERLNDGTRSRRPRTDALEWLRHADVVQCNLAEAASLCGLPTDAGTAAVVAGLHDLLVAAARPQLGLLSHGTGGATLVRPRCDPLHLPVPRRVNGDPTGAGDTLGAVFLARWLDGADPEVALLAAMKHAAAACEASGIRGAGSR